MNSIIIACNSCGTKNRVPATKQHLSASCGKCKNSIKLRPMNAVAVELEDNSFAGLIDNAPLPVMVDFFSPTCGPCRMLAPTIESLTKHFFGKAIIAKLDTSRNQITAARFQIRSVPTLILFKNGKAVDQLTGAVPEQTLAQMINKFL